MPFVHSFFGACAPLRCGYFLRGSGEGEGVISGGSQAAATKAEQFAHAYQALHRDSSIQFTLTPPPAPPEPPRWLDAFFRWLSHVLKPVGRALEWIASFFPDAQYARVLLWFVIACGAAALLWALYNRMRYGEWRFRLPRLTSAEPIEAEEPWAPEEAGARSWLEEADALAREGRFAEAIHHLLFRSIEDIAKRRPALVRPALTSRELSVSQGIPGAARELFASIARLVERSLFGGRSVNEPDWLKARQAYSDFALPNAWRA
jgi:hypothetical protein